MTRRPRITPALAFALSVAAALAVVPLKSALNTAVGDDIGFLPAMAAVVFAAWLGGFTPGLVATGLSMVLEAYFFMKPVDQLYVALASDQVRLALFGLVGILVSWLTWLRAQAEEGAHRAREEAEVARERLDVIVRRLITLQELGARLAKAVTSDEITEALLVHGIAALEADGGAVFLLSPGGDDLEAIGWSGYGTAKARTLSRLPLHLPTPATDVARTGTPIYIEDPAAYVARYGATLEAQGVPVEARAVAAVPLEVEGRRFGVLGFTWDRWRDFPADRRTFIAALARLGAGALEQTRLAERDGRHVAELEAVIGTIGEGIIVTEADGSIRSANGAAVRLLGGRVVSVDDLLDCLREPGGSAPRELPRDSTEFQLRDRPNAWVEVMSYPMAGTPGRGGVEARPTVVVCRDVTAFRQGQGLREAFLSLLSHELRTPVTTIYGGSSVLTRPGRAISDETKAEILADIAEEANRLYRLVEDLLVLARFDEDVELGAEPSLLQHVVPAVVQLERSRWPAIRFEVQVDPDLPAVSADETAVQQVVRNLLSNAAKYSGIDGVVNIRVELAEDEVAVRVRDHGAGIDPLEVENLFDPFYRSPNTARMAGGAGIGLYVSRRLADAMGGRIWARPAEGGGSEFTVVLPVYQGDPSD